MNRVNYRKTSKVSQGFVDKVLLRCTPGVVTARFPLQA